MGSLLKEFALGVCSYRGIAIENGGKHGTASAVGETACLRGRCRQ